MLSRTSEYVLRAMALMAQQVDEWPLPSPRIAEQTGIPRKYLSNILSSLVRAGILQSAPGIGGGFRMTRSPKVVFLREVLEPFEPALGPTRPCPFGQEVCNDTDPCAGHERWKRVREAYADFLQHTSVYDIGVEQNGSTKRKRR